MTVEELIALRKKMMMTQGGLAAELGMSTRAVQDIENGRAELRRVHILAVERIAMLAALLYDDLTYLPANVHADIIELAGRDALTKQSPA